MSALQTLEHDFHDFIILNNHPYFFYIHDTKGVFTYLSKDITSLLGFSQTEFQTQYLTHLTANHINKKVILHTERSLQGIQQEPYKVEIYDKEYKIHLLEVYEKPVFEEDVVVAVEGIAKLLN